MTRGVQVVMSTRINSVLDALMSALIAVDIDTTWRFLTEYWVVVMVSNVWCQIAAVGILMPALCVRCRYQYLGSVVGTNSGKCNV